MILRHRPHPPRGLSAALLLALPGVAVAIGPATASAQALGTMQVTAFVVPAPMAWPTLAATAELAAAAQPASGAGGSATPTRLEIGLARVELDREPRPDGRALIRVDYLRN